ncbi:DUF445 domain-containing protein [Parasegetibacter sp. NRK P23]|uniref:DUF445 domain-containing protein n=1 Tax=Parasegetibacter sp. NRK P23 TaxID=2942999 RepID=UPI0020432295|nr:DUF445 family protein [Parasegetibacter sp. NRK P23]MCM5528456.1 DUF445 family protein [Parasegetibacter sp. NRK P23]
MIYLLPIIAAFTGWITNKIAIKLLFHPRVPVRFMGMTIQGVFPKRQQQFAEKLGKLVSRELLSFDDIKQKIARPENVHKVMPLVEKHIDHFLQVKLGEKMPIVRAFVGESTLNQMKSILMEELEALFPALMEDYMHQVKTDLDLEQIVTRKIAAFSTDKLEAILMQIMSKEFVFIEVIGAVLGFIIGLIQLGLTFL